MPSTYSRILDVEQDETSDTLPGALSPLWRLTRMVDLSTIRYRCCYRNDLKHVHCDAEKRRSRQEPDDDRNGSI
jgi:hypothetical protein